ncbi:MAG: GIY-YIG nuclease family protein [Gammaproteobacteria bacterium]|nr:GIY-YIG nuclease family protein [Gammaproteobacteria bacterium]
MANVYLIHFTPSLKQAKHYCGYTPGSVQARLRKHRSGTGACICKAAVKAGCKLTIVKVWHFGTDHEARLFERALKNSHNLKHCCHLCTRKKHST